MSKQTLVLCADAHHAQLLRWAQMGVHELPSLAHAYADMRLNDDPEHPLDPQLIQACSGKRVLVCHAPKQAKSALALAQAILVQSRAIQSALCEVPVGAHQA